MNQVMPTSYLQTSSQTIFAAEAGVNAVVGQIRTSESVATPLGVYGDTASLPCESAPVMGTVGGATSDLRYEAVVRYFREDPTGQTEAWLDANKITCAVGSGPVQNPVYALITSTGIGAPVPGLAGISGDRVLQAVYEFQVTNSNIPGGLIFDQDDAAALDRKFCLEAQGLVAGAYVRYAPVAECGDDPDHQLWIYAESYQLKLASTTIDSSGLDPLCITRPSSGAMGLVTLQLCKATTDAARWNQLYSFNAQLGFTAENRYITDYEETSSTRVVLAANTSSLSGTSRLQVKSESNTLGRDAIHSFTPEPSVGAANASHDTKQIVNFYEFGRCFDVTRQDLNRTFLIVYPCKQDPSGGSHLAWNHEFYYDEPADGLGSRGPQQIYFMSAKVGDTKYCLYSQGEGNYVHWRSPCRGTADEQWTRHASTNTLGEYTIRDRNGLCVSIGSPYPPATDDLKNWSTVITEACNGEDWQMWNAPPSTVSASVGGYQEIS
ncbi:MAG TPA: RICIN domain-containing protein, partial [Coriobacteriia bacterium]|nr:RICIN domain-containing protein [Coriobacteriia bacterium]